MESENNIYSLLKEVRNVFGTGVANTAHERYEQITKHGFSLQKDAKYYQKGELVEAARFCLGIGNWPKGWNKVFMDKIISKSDFERYTIAAAFLCAEMDRLSSTPNNF